MMRSSFVWGGRKVMEMISSLCMAVQYMIATSMRMTHDKGSF